MNQDILIAIIVSALVAVIVGIVIGRVSAGGKKRVAELESELAKEREALSDYREEVEAHFDKTASLFVSMAGNYKDLFEHLSSGSEKISAGPARKRFRERVDALLLGDAADSKLLTAEPEPTPGAVTEVAPEAAAEPAREASEAPADETPATEPTEAAAEAPVDKVEGEAAKEEAAESDAAEPEATEQEEAKAAKV